MLLKYIYNHLNGLEFIQMRKPHLWNELQAAIQSVDANACLKTSDDKTKKNATIYAQTKINKAIKDFLTPRGWKSFTTGYYVTEDIETARTISTIRDASEQKKVITGNGFHALYTNNQVDFVKERCAIEVQFGKYFSVAYDLHVKHTFFFLRNDIDVGIEVIPTHDMQQRMDTGVAWWENEVANIIREGRTNPTVPVIVIGIEPEKLIDLPKHSPDL